MVFSLNFLSLSLSHSTIERPLIFTYLRDLCTNESKFQEDSCCFFFPFLFWLFFPLAYENIRTLKTYVVQRGDTRDCRWALQKHRLIPDASEEIKSVIPLFLRTSSKAVFKDGGKSSMGMAMGEAKVAEPTEPSAPTLSAFYCQGK